MAGRDIVKNLITNDKSSKSLKAVENAAEKTADSFEELSLAEQRAALEAEKAAVRVQKASAALDRAVQRHGKESDQAREATLRLRSAQLALAEASEKTADKVDDVGDAAERADDQVGKLGGGIGGLTGILGGAVAGLGRAGARMGAFATVTLTAVPGVVALGLKVGALAVKFGQMGLAIAPAAASLPGLAASFAFARATITAGAPGIVAGVKPVTDQFKKLQTHLQDVAGRGLPSLSRQFLAVNFPTIAGAMNRITVAVNGVVRGVGAWINTENGQRAIRAVVNGTATAVEALAPHVTNVAIALGQMVAAAGPAVFERLSKVLGWAADRAADFFRSFRRGEINEAWDKIDGYAGALIDFAGKFREVGGVVMGGVRWWKANADAIQHVRDILGVVTIAVGIATGGWIPALVAGVSLLIAHWDKVSVAMESAKRWFNGTSEEATAARGVVDGLSGAVGDLSSWFTGKLLPALERAGGAILPSLRDAVGQVSRTFNENRSMIGKAEGVLAALGVVLTEAVIPALTWLFQHVLPVVTSQFTGMITGVNNVVLPGMRIFTRMMLGFFGSLLDGAEFAFGWMPGIGPQLHDAAAKFRTFRDQVNHALSGITDQQVTVSAKINYTTGTGTASGGTKVGFRAAGGIITGPGGPRDDRIPAMLSNGEFVVNARDTARHRPLLEHINAGRYANGGLVVDTRTDGLAATMAAQRRALAAAAKRLAPDLLANFGGPVSSAGARALGRQMAAAYGWVGGQWAALERLWTGESGWNPRAKNPTSTAFGIPQFLKSTARAYGLAYGDTNASHQIAAGLRYIRDAYGSPGRAFSMWSGRHPHWYGNGGVINEPVMGIGMRSGDRYGFAERGPETVVPGRVQLGRAGGGYTHVEVNLHAPNYVGSRSEMRQMLTDMASAGQLDVVMKRAGVKT